MANKYFVVIDPLFLLHCNNLLISYDDYRAIFMLSMHFIFKNIMASAIIALQLYGYLYNSVLRTCISCLLVRGQKIKIKYFTFLGRHVWSILNMTSIDPLVTSIDPRVTYIDLYVTYTDPYVHDL